MPAGREIGEETVERLGSYEARRLLTILEMPLSVRTELASAMSEQADGRAIAEVVREVDADPTGTTRERLIEGLTLALDDGPP